MSAKLRYGFNVFWSHEDEAYIATCPEFPRLSGFGDTPEEALGSMEEVLREALATYEEEGWTPPEPFDPGGASGKFQVRISRTQHAALVRRAESEGVSMNALIAQYISAGLSRGDAGADVSSHVERRLEAVLKRVERQLRATHVTAKRRRPGTRPTVARRPKNG